MFKRKPKSLGVFKRFGGYYTPAQRYDWIQYWQAYAYRLWIAARIAGTKPTLPIEAVEPLVESHYKVMRRITLNKIRKARAEGKDFHAMQRSLITLRWYHDDTKDFIVAQREANAAGD